MHRKVSLRSKISSAIIGVVIFIALCAIITGVVSMRDISSTLLHSNQEMGRISSEKSSESLTELTSRRLRELAADKADAVDNMFLDFEQDVCVAASVCTQLYAHPEAYAERDVPAPDPANDGKLAIQILYAPDLDPSDEALAKEARLVGNIQDTLVAINANNDYMVSNYIATESGLMVQADYISGKKFDESGNVLPMNARGRPWYIGAAQTGAPYFTPVTRDVHTPSMTIMCGVPIYKDGQLMAVSGAGIYLDRVDALVQSIDIGQSGDACIMNRYGQILFSTFETGSLVAPKNEADLKVSQDTGLAVLRAKTFSGESGVQQVTIDGVRRCVAYAPMETVGWSMFIILPLEEVEAPTRQLQESLGMITEDAIGTAQTQIRHTLIVLAAMLAAAVFIAIVISMLLSRHIVRPISRLTEKVHAVEGDNLDFVWDMNTGDETQLLGESFQSLLQRMQAYIDNIQTITADKERISTELTLAKRIQESMLPNIFPAFPECREFDIYATMQPAKEVGGDFYDFFLIDKDHLCMVIADVSGKGVPAALFMMISKIMLKNCAMFGMSVADILSNANEVICANNRQEMFVTVWIGILEISTGKLTAANAGHEYPFIQKNGRYEILKDRHGFVIGGMENMKYHEYTLQLEPGDAIFLYTDGVTEANDVHHALFGLDRLRSALNSAPEMSCQEVIATVNAAINDFVRDASQFDDITMLSMKYNGPV